MTSVFRTIARRLAALALLAGVAGPALAHPGHAQAAGFVQGLLHPLGGLDHLLAMLAVGAWSAAALPAGRRWSGPALFTGALLAGAALGTFGALGVAGSALLEPAVAASVLLLGLLLAAPARTPAAAGALLAAAAGLAHGLAHGAEAPAAGLFAAYAAGFVLTTGALHAAGVAAGGALRDAPAALRRALAGGVALAGVALLAARV